MVILQIEKKEEDWIKIKKQRIKMKNVIFINVKVNIEQEIYNCLFKNRKRKQKKTKFVK